MSYREKIEKYRKNQLSEEERKDVEAEIEKAEAIEEYLSDQLDEELRLEDKAFQNANNMQEKSINKDIEYEKLQNAGTKIIKKTGKDERNSRDLLNEVQFEEYVKKSIHRIFRKITLGTGAVLLAILLFVQFGLSPLVSSFYYNPAKQIKVKMESDGDSESWESSESQFGIDFGIFSELTMPCRSTDYARAVTQGYGNYYFQINPTIGYETQSRQGIAGQIKRGKMEAYTPGYFQAIQDNYFIAYGLDRNKNFRKQIENSVIDYGDYSVSTSQWVYASLEDGEETVRSLDKDGFYYAYVSFDQPLSYDEINKLMDQLQNDVSVMGNPWIAVYASEGDYMRTLGYDYENTKNSIWKIPAEYNERYPEISLFSKNSYSDEVYEEAQSKLKNEKAMTQHMVSMLRYMADQKKFTKMMEDISGSDINWSLAADYIEENGLKSYGFVCVTTKADMQKMLTEDHILGIAVKEWK